jgi:DNA-binding helix-hairpin-helix protein with protein kinase domain
VQAARNTAAAVETVHAHGHVIGDVNQQNFTVAPNATVMLVDCDGFQISLNGSLYPCEVGVAHFIPPELQGKSFRDVTRTRDHDAFGLAVLCFHLLFMGRHPFAGRFLGAGDMPLERAIAEQRFAYGSSARRLLMQPPPAALPMSAVPAEIAALFESAFSSPSRPTATQWRLALEATSRQLKTCTRVPVHRYYANAAACTWCELEGRAGVIFFLGAAPASTAILFDLTAVWRAIESIAPPRQLPPRPQPVITGITPRPFEARNQRQMTVVARRGVAGHHGHRSDRRRNAADHRCASGPPRSSRAR